MLGTKSDNVCHKHSIQLVTTYHQGLQPKWQQQKQHKVMFAANVASMKMVFYAHA
jgi:hypothetical protein